MYGMGFFINSYIFGISGYFLDNFNPYILYSLHRVDANDSSLIRVRRSSDNLELDFNATEIEDGTLTTWTGANDGFVVKMYNLGTGGSTYDATQSTTTKQPKIVNGGILITDPNNGYASIQFNGTSNVFSLGSNYTLNSTFTEVHVFNRVSSGLKSLGLGISSSVNPYITYWFTDNKTYFKPSSGTPNANFDADTSTGSKLNFCNYTSTSGNAYSYRNDIQMTPIPLYQSWSGSVNVFNQFGARGTDYRNDMFQFYSLFETDESVNRTDIQNLINNALNIY